MLSQDFKEFIALLDKHAVEYMVIGGYAVALHGHPRYTKDIDIWVGREHGNSRRLLAAIDEFGMGSLGLTVSDLQTDASVVQLGLPPNRIDLITGIADLSFQDAYARHERIEIDGVSIRYTSKNDLVATKKVAGRLQDLADIEHLNDLAQ